MALQVSNTCSIIPKILLVLFIFSSTCIEISIAAIKMEITPDSNYVLLNWTAPGDDGRVGQAAVYDIRYSTEGVGNDTAAWWEMADTVSGEPTPAPAGQKQYFTIAGLQADETYYFALKTADEVPNLSKISNIASTEYFYCADVNDDQQVNIFDVISIIKYLYLNLIIPAPGTGDVNNSGEINIFDIAYLINYLYRNGPPPICE